ncbi:MAG: cell division protein FtsW, partial [Microbacteriaceae bacterium]
MSTRTPPTPPGAAATKPQRRPERLAGDARPGSGGAVIAVRRVFNPQSSNFFLLLGTTMFLVIFGLVM